MNKMIGVTERLWAKGKKAIVGVGSAATMAMASTSPAFAATQIKTDLDTETVIGGILDVIFKIALYIGIVIAVVGVFSFILAFKDDNAEAQSRGIRLAIVGCALIGLKVLVELTGLIKKG